MRFESEMFKIQNPLRIPGKRIKGAHWKKGFMPFCGVAPRQLLLSASSLAQRRCLHRHGDMLLPAQLHCARNESCMLTKTPCECGEVSPRSSPRQSQPYRSRSTWLSAVKFVQTSSRAPCGYKSPDMSSRICFMSAHILSNEEAEMRWHLRSTCQVMGV